VKTTICAISLLSAAAAISLLQAETAYTDPVMAQSKSLPTGYSVVSINALNSIEASGIIDGLSVDGETTILEVSSVPDDWSTNSFADPGNVVQFNDFRKNGEGQTVYVPLYYVEITSAPEGGTSKVGQILDVFATTAGDPNTLTVGGDLSSIESSLVDQTFVIRKKRTLEDVFGRYNDVGFVGGTDFSKCDIIYNLYNGDFERIYYQDSPVDIFDGWRVLGLSDEANDLCIDPDFGLMIYRQPSDSSSTIDVVSVGDVKLNTARTVIDTGYNAISMKFPVGFTLGTSGLYKSDGSVLTGGTNLSEVDIVYILHEETGVFRRYYYQDSPIDIFDGWRWQNDTTQVADNTEIPSGSMIMVFRRGNAVEWVMPQPFELAN